MKPKKEESNLSSGDGGKTRSQPPIEAIENLVVVDSGGGSKRFDGALGDDGVSVKFKITFKNQIYTTFPIYD